MPDALPIDGREWMEKAWAEIEPYYQELHRRPLHAGTVDAWLADWSNLSAVMAEVYQRLWVATTLDTTDLPAEQRYHAYLDGVYPNLQAAEQQLKDRLLDSGLEPAGYEMPLRNLRAQAQVYRQENLPLLTQEMKLAADYERIIGAQTVTWDGEEKTVMQLSPLLQEPQRAQRERAWRLGAERQLADRGAINEVWRQAVALRQQIAANAGLQGPGGADYRAYTWVQLLRFDYTPDDCRRFHSAIEQVVVPAAQRLYERRRQRLGVATLRPWDLDVDPAGRPPLRPYRDLAHLQDGIQAIFNHIDPTLGRYFAAMRTEGLLDMENRKGKAPGGYCTEFFAACRPFIFMNAVNVHDDVQTLLHEGGHAFHVFETARLPYLQKSIGLEFAEVASMSMELLGAPYLTHDQGGFYTPEEAARARLWHLEGMVTFLPYMVVVDAFQHWAYEHPTQAQDPAACDGQWDALWQRFMPGIDYRGLEDVRATGWQRKPHIHTSPFYYIEYGLAQLGALQVWRNALADPAGAVRAYRQALALGGSRPLPDLYAAAGARLVFDAAGLEPLIDLVEQTMQDLEAANA
ncbi:MAG: M3 family oligoendopeptidase [Chloroflexota bacterium]